MPLPVDVVCAKELSANAVAVTKAATDIADDDLILDIGPRTAAQLTDLLGSAATIVWNGPVGVFEHEQFAAGTRAIAQAIASSCAFSLAGGGETVAALAKFGVTDKIGYVSTAGGAFLEFLEGKTLPAVEILEQRAAARLLRSTVQRSTKIVATLGPACSDRETLTRIIAAGVDVVRMNFSHGTADDHVRRAELVREVSRSLEHTVGIMVDLQGPKIRIGKFDQGSITLKKGDPLILDAACQHGQPGARGTGLQGAPARRARGRRAAAG